MSFGNRVFKSLKHAVWSTLLCAVILPVVCLLIWTAWLVIKGVFFASVILTAVFLALLSIEFVTEFVEQWKKEGKK
jgi:hypothetical protein